MFWRDPTLYGASFPYKDFNMPIQGQFPMWQNIPRQMPHTYGFMPQYALPQFNVPQYNVPQYTLPQFNVPQFNVPQYALPQFNVPQFNIPQWDVPQHNIPQMNMPFFHTQGFTPQLRPFLPYDVNLFRPFI